MTNISESFHKLQEKASELSKAFAPQITPPVDGSKDQPIMYVFFMDVTNAIGKPAGEGTIEVGKWVIDLTLPAEDQYLPLAADWELVPAGESPIESALPSLKRRV